MNKLDTIFKWTIMGLLAAALIYGGIRKRMYDSTIIELQNAVAAKDTTIEAAKNTYSKLVLETDNLKALLSNQDAQMAALKETIRKRDEELISTSNLVVYWKKKFEGAGSGTSHTEPGPSGDRQRVSFTHNWGYIGIEGSTLTNPPEYSVKVSQLRPLALTLVVGQLPDGSWKADVVSSEEDVGVDIRLAAVNPRVISPRWYEGIGLNVDTGVGLIGFIGGLGASYNFGAFNVGPKVFLAASADGVKIAYGASLTWHPFKR